MTRKDDLDALISRVRGLEGPSPETTAAIRARYRKIVHDMPQPPRDCPETPQMECGDVLMDAIINFFRTRAAR